MLRHVHSRPIMIPDLKKMNILIDDYTDNVELKRIIRQYSDFMLQYIATEYLSKGKNIRFIHTKLFF
jgi:hypothetical protein